MSPWQWPGGGVLWGRLVLNPSGDPIRIGALPPRGAGGGDPDAAAGGAAGAVHPGPQRAPPRHRRRALRRPGPTEREPSGGGGSRMGSERRRGGGLWWVPVDPGGDTTDNWDTTHWAKTGQVLVGTAEPRPPPPLPPHSPPPPPLGCMAWRGSASRGMRVDPVPPRPSPLSRGFFKLKGFEILNSKFSQ